MNNPSSRRQRGFTLVELLVVIAIIAVLASAGFGAGAAAIQKAKKVKALASCTALETAVNNFYTEYGSLPTQVVTNGPDDAPPLDTKLDLDFLRVLLGFETGTQPMNTRAIKFLSAKEGKGATTTSPSDGLIYSTDGKDVKGLYDPWGGTYKVALDTSMDEIVKAEPKGGTNITLNGRRVVAWSDGADGVKKKGTATDDVITWQK